VATRMQTRSYFAKAAPTSSAASSADPWSAAPHQEAALRDAIMKATVR
jgi:hypothetical protein